MPNCTVMSTPTLRELPRPLIPVSDPHDRALVRHMLTMTPTERLHNVAAYWPLVRIGLERRAAASGVARP